MTEPFSGIPKNDHTARFNPQGKKKNVNWTFQEVNLILSWL